MLKRRSKILLGAHWDFQMEHITLNSSLNNITLLLNQSDSKVDTTFLFSDITLEFSDWVNLETFSEITVEFCVTGIFQCILIRVQGPMGLGNLRIFTIAINLQTIALHGSTLYIFVHYYKLEIVIFKCPRYSWIKEEKLLKVRDVSYWKISAILGGKYRPFFHWDWGRNSAPKRALKKNLCDITHRGYNSSKICKLSHRTRKSTWQTRLL